ncbi:MAG: bifunctional phosphopantothenoylcysteine decarboxylase/phosphopantothenate--cysteine ligase CoaBC [Pseudomonadota bacterium]
MTDQAADHNALDGKRVLLIIGGGIAAYKCLDLIRRLRERGCQVRCVMTKAAEAFVTPLSVGAISNERVFQHLFDLNDEHEIGHIRLSREADVLVVAPATADLLARMAGGHGDDLATTVLLATDKPVLVAPAMNPRMWAHPATQRNIAQLKRDGLGVVGPEAGEMAERDETGVGRMSEPMALVDAIAQHFAKAAGSSSVAGPKPDAPDTSALANRHVLITAGPTHEPIDPVRYIANRSSGKQGYAIARAARDAGARVTLVSGPTALPPPQGVEVVDVETARDMLAAVERALPADVAVCAAAVADWHVSNAATQKLKKGTNPDRPAIAVGPSLTFAENPDILATIAQHRTHRPGLVIGFAAETNDVVANAQGKLARKGCDWIIANDVSRDAAGRGVMGGDDNRVHLITADGVDTWPQAPKTQVAGLIVEAIARALQKAKP